MGDDYFEKFFHQKVTFFQKGCQKGERFN